MKCPKCGGEMTCDGFADFGDEDEELGLVLTRREWVYSCDNGHPETPAMRVEIPTDRVRPFGFYRIR